MSENRSTSQKFLSGLFLKPLSVAYGAVTATRNKMFDLGILEQRKFDIPVLVVGNIAVGGTGKTPHTEYLINLLRKQFKIGVLSRGYNRKLRGLSSLMQMRMQQPSEMSRSRSMRNLDNMA